jgi:hypothetical protein
MNVSTWSSEANTKVGYNPNPFGNAESALQRELEMLEDTIPAKQEIC